MKKFNLFLVITFCFSTVYAQEDLGYFHQNEGESLKYNNYDENNKLLRTSIKTVLRKNVIKNGIKVDYVEKIKPVGEATITQYFSAHCINGQILLDVVNWLRSNPKYQSMNIEVKGDEAYFPTNPKVGDRFEEVDFDLHLTKGKLPIMSFDIHVFDRKIVALEDVQTPAGKFKALKYEQNIEVSTIFMKLKRKSIEWYTKEYGVIKMITLNEAMQVRSTYILTEIMK